MNNFFQKISQKFNTIFQYPELFPTLFNNVDRGFCKDLLYFKKNMGFNFTTIIDVGAALGDYSKAVHFIYPDAKIYAFEPVPQSFEVLKTVANKINNLQCFNLALSDNEGETEFHLNEFSFSSSLLKMTDTHKEIFPFAKNEETIMVNTIKLDDFCKNERIVFGSEKYILLKIDVQGLELKVLKGATNLLKEIDVIQLEVSFMNFYEGQASIEDIILFLKPFGFNSLVQVSPVFDQSKLLYSDFLFIKNG